MAHSVEQPITRLGMPQSWMFFEVLGQGVPQPIACATCINVDNDADVSPI